MNKYEDTEDLHKRWEDIRNQINKGNKVNKSFASTNKLPIIGDVQVDKNKSEWVIISIYGRRVSRVRRYSLAHRIHADGAPEIAKSLQVAF